MTVDTLTLEPGDALAARLKSIFLASGYDPVDPPMLLPAELVLDRLGEDLRRRLLLVTGPDGREMCLRPDFTLPLAYSHVGKAENDIGRYAYAGLVFRFPPVDDSNRQRVEIRQAGIEHFGDPNVAEADAEVLAATVAATQGVGLGDTELTLGDVGLFDAFLTTLSLGTAWEARLRRAFRAEEFAKSPVVEMLSPAPGSGEISDQKFGVALSAMNPVAARAVVEEVMAIAGTAPVGGRTPAEIARRLVDQAQLRETPVDAALIAEIERFLSIAAAPHDGLAQVRELATGNPEMKKALEDCGRRFDLVEAAGVDMSSATFRSEFSGRIEYYTGMVFDLRISRMPRLGSIASGGRYDGFLGEFGADRRVQAVGGSVYVDRLITALGSET